MSPVRSTVTIIGNRLEPGHHEVRDFLTRIAQPHRWLEAGSADADAAMARLGNSPVELPIVVEGDRVLSAVTPRALAEAWNMSQPPSRREYDIAIVGAGPAGLSAAVYAASDGLTTILLERDIPGGQASHTSAIENFFGFPDGIGGAELARLAGRQAEGFGAELTLLRGASGNRRAPDGRFVIEVEGGYEMSAPVVIAATGMDWRRLTVEGLDELLGRGVYYGAGRSEAAQCAGEDAIVVGAGNSAGQAVLHLARAGARVTMIVRGDRLGRTMSEYLVRRIEESRLIEVRFATEVHAVQADAGRLASVTIAGADGVESRLPARTLFICIGGVPRTSWAAGSGVRTDTAGYVLTGPDLLDRGERPAGWPLARDPLVLETSVPGFFAAGDVRHGSTKRVAGAVGDGAMAIALAHHRLEELTAAVASSDHEQVARTRSMQRRRGRSTLASGVKPPLGDGDDRASTRAIDASEPALPGGDVTVDEMSDASFPASDSPSRWTWEIPANAADADVAKHRHR
ncbi:MAG TPA: NAD(P)/FAD-dependent oxidoreductase [Gaiellaceae bacterium]|nr:NAD(P)/FAD-dependent oxidoreductase [Gaiellaceae bacterium]